MAVCLVTGGAGFIGSYVVDTLIQDGHDVVVLDDLSGGFLRNVNKRAEFIRGSVVNVELVKKIFDRYKFDYVFHLAAYAAEGLSHFIRRFNYRNNLLGSINLINASVNEGTVRCFVFTSSIAVYGSSQTPMRENMIPTPEDPYGIAKYAVELDLKAAGEMFGLNYIIFRPHNVYGERQNIGDKYRNVVGIFMNQALQGKALTIFGDGKQTRAFSYISDVAPVIARSVVNEKAYGEIFNIGAETPVEVRRIAELVSQEMGLELKIKYLEKRNEVKHAFSDHKKARQLLATKTDGVKIEDGVARMAKWVKKHGTRKTREFSRVEVKHNMPEGWKSESS